MDPTQLQPGHKLDRYELLCPLAYGGMASVWLARFQGTSRRRGFERLVVVKMILPQYAEDPRFQEMFLDEARIASKIEHVNVARILDVGEHAESTFIVMEWIDGDSLSKVIRAAEQKKQFVPAGIALRICADAAAGLHAAHILEERDGTLLGVVHRDVSPQNILVSNNGTTVIIDFGVAKARDRVAQDTSTGQLKGKIRYMAPEQALGRELDHRADIWAVGAILYELFSGRAPFDGPNEIAMLKGLTAGSPPDPLPSSVPEPVRAVVARALSYAPDDRYATALELNLALETAMVELGEPTGAAAVALYTGQLLADRKLARRRAVDDALAIVTAREAERISPNAPVAVTPPPPSMSSAPGSGPRPASSSGMPVAMHVENTVQMPAAARLAAGTSGSLTPIAQPFSYPAPSPSRPSGLGLGFGESPSASSATLGSTSLEYPPDDAARSRRVVTAAVLAVSVLAGTAGIALIISAAVLRHSAAADGAGAAAGQNAVTPPANVPEPAPLAAASTTVPADSSAVPSASVALVAPVTSAPTATPAPHRITPAPLRPRPITTTTTAATSAATPAAPPAAPSRPDRGF